jgi:hypothetical protein
VLGDLERGRDEQAQAITQVELVMRSLNTPKQRSMFLCQYAGLYAQTAITDVQRNQDEQARSALQHFARISCGAELARHLEAYEHILPAQGEKVPEGELLSSIHELVRLITAYEDAVSTQHEGAPEEELLSNRKLVERLKQIRRGL